MRIRRHVMILPEGIQLIQWTEDSFERLLSENAVIKEKLEFA